MLSLEAVRFDCSSVTAGSGRKITWRCARGHEWQAKILNRTAAGSGCPYCANKKALKGFNDLASLHPNLANEAFGWDPTTFTVGSDKSQIWKCPQGHKWKAAIKTRTREKYRSGCPICSNKRSANWALVIAAVSRLSTENSIARTPTYFLLCYTRWRAPSVLPKWSMTAFTVDSI